MSERRRCARYIASSAPCTVSSGWSGWISVNPGSPAAVSFTAGLYFMVHEPRG